MSRQSEAKKARRKKRRAGREPRSDAEENVGVDQAVALIDAWLGERGWVLDADNSEDLVCWLYPPSAVDFPDPETEPVTRLWITVDENDDEVVLEFGAMLVGAYGVDDVYLLDPDTLADDIAALEAYRPGSPRPELA